MKKIPVIIALVAVAFVAYSMSNWDKVFGKSITASKNITTETRTVSDFDELEVDGIFAVDVTYGSEESVEVEAPDNLMEYIELSVKSGKLTIDVNRKTKITSNCALKIHIKTAKLNGFTTSGASSITLNNTLKDNSLSINSSGAASFKGEVDVDNADIELDGAATVDLVGTAATASLSLSGASQVNDYDFKVGELSVDLSGASTATVTSLKSVKGDLSGASSLSYKGSPSVKNVSTSGAASLKER